MSTQKRFSRTPVLTEDAMAFLDGAKTFTRKELNSIAEADQAAAGTASDDKGGDTGRIRIGEAQAGDAERRTPFVDALSDSETSVATGKARNKAKLERPWDKADPRVKPSVLIRMPEELHLKLMYLKSVVPAASMNSMCLDGISQVVEKLLKQYDKGADV